MKYGILSRNKSINTKIYQSFELIDTNDVESFVSKFMSEIREQKNHTFRELITGAYLASNGLNVKYEQTISGKTPDWSVVGTYGDIEEIIDVVTIHQRREIEKDMIETLSRDEIWCDWMTVPPDHIYSKIEAKSNSYSKIINERKLPYTICIFGEFFSDIQPDEVRHVLYDHHGGLFLNNSGVAGVLFFLENNGIYNFTYFPNHEAQYPSKHINSVFSNERTQA
jgi:hypothetical protein